MNEVLSFLAGFVVAYLMIRAIRGFGMRNMVVAGCALMLLGEEEAQASVDVHWSIENTSGSTASFRLFRRVRSGCSGVGSQTTIHTETNLEHGQTASGTASLSDMNDANCYSFEFGKNTSGSYNIVASTESVQYPGNPALSVDAVYLTFGTPGTGTIDVQGSGPDVWLYHPSVTNTNMFDGVYTLEWYSGTNLVDSGFINVAAGDTWEVEWETEFADLTWQIKGPGGIENDFVPKVWSSGGGTNLGPNEGDPTESPGAGTFEPSDPFEFLPQYEPTATNAMIAARQDAAGIVKALGELRGEFRNQGSDNRDLLEQIRDSSALAATNTHRDFISDAHVLDTNLWAVANEAHTNILDWVSELENAPNIAAVDVPTGLLSIPIPWAFGATKALTLDLDDVENSFMAKIGPWGDWLHEFFLYMTGFILFWLFYHHSREYMLSSIDHARDVKAPDILKVMKASAVAAVVLPLLVSVLGLLPFFAYSQMSDTIATVNVSPLLPNVAMMISDGIDGPTGEMTFAAGRFAGMFASVVPLETIILAVLTWLAFQLAIFYLFIFVTSALRLLGFFSALLLLANVDCGAAQVRVLNVSTNAVVWSSGTMRIDFPRGVTEINIDGTWTDSVGTVPLNDTPFVQIFRYHDDAGALARAKGEAYSDWDWFAVGFAFGLTLFGFSWMVSEIVAGLRVGSQTFG